MTIGLWSNVKKTLVRDSDRVLEDTRSLQRRRRYSPRQLAKCKMPKMAETSGDETLEWTPKKQLVAEALTDLHPRLSALPTRSHERHMIMQETANLYGVSEQTVYRVVDGRRNFSIFPHRVNKFRRIFHILLKSPKVGVVGGFGRARN